MEYIHLSFKKKTVLSFFLATQYFFFCTMLSFQLHSKILDFPKRFFFLRIEPFPSFKLTSKGLGKKADEWDWSTSHRKTL